MNKKTFFSMLMLIGVSGVCAEEPFDSINKGDLDGLKKFIKEDKASINKKNKDGRTPLFEAVNKKNGDMVQLLLANGAKESINTGDKDEVTPLNLAIASNNLNIAQLLLENGADVHKRNKSGNTLLYAAVWRGNIKMVRLLLANGAKIESNKDGRKPLHKAIELNNIDLAELLLANGAKINELDENGITPLHQVIKRNDINLAEFLLKNGADQSITDKNGETPLFTAISNGEGIDNKYYKDTIKFLLKNGADQYINKSNNYGVTPLHKAIKRGNIDLAELLLAKGADLSIADKKVTTPLLSAVEINTSSSDSTLYLDMIKFLLKQGHAIRKSINMANSEGITPLYLAVKSEKLYMVKLLLYMGANVTKKILELNPSNKTIALLIKKPIYLESTLSDEEKKEFAKLLGDKDIYPSFESGLEGEDKETKIINIYK